MSDAQYADTTMDNARREVRQEHPSWSTEQIRLEAIRRFHSQYTVQRRDGIFVALERK